jgi:phenylacetate-CoA ligase
MSNFAPLDPLILDRRVVSGALPDKVSTTPAVTSSPFLSIRSNIPGIVWPPISHGPAADLAAMIQQHDRTQWMPGDQLEEMQFRQLLALAEHCEKHSPQFKRRLESAGLVATDLSGFAGLRKLPVLHRRDLQEATDIFCREVPAAHLPVGEAQTSGSTGEPVSVRRTSIGNFDWHAMTLRDHIWHGRDFSKSQCAVRANVTTLTRAADWGPPVNQMFATGPILAIPITADIDRQIDWIRDFAPDYLLNYASDLLAVIRRCIERDIRLDGISQIRMVGETVTPAVREEIGSFFNAKVIDSYTSQEFGHIALECPGSPLYHVMAETLVVEILDAHGAPCPEGTVGRVVITDLHNFATPLIRYDIGDYAEAGPHCPCGRTLPTLRRILGRERNIVRKPDGTRNWPLVGYARFRDIAPVRQFQVVQTKLDSIEVRLAVERPLSESEEKKLGTTINEALEYPFQITFRYFEDRIPTGPNGKYEEFMSLIS